MGNAQGIERRIHDEATNYEGDLCFLSFGTAGCFGHQSDDEHHHSDDRGSEEWERSRGLGPVKGDSAKAKPTQKKMKRPCLLSCSMGNCLATKARRSTEDDRGRDDRAETIFSCGCAHIGCLTPKWLNPASSAPDDEDEQRRLQRQHELRVKVDLAVLKAREERPKAKASSTRGSGEVEISPPHPGSFQRTTDDFIAAHLAMCPDPRARVKTDGESRVSLEASAPPPPSTDGPWEEEADQPSPASLPPPPAATSREEDRSLDGRGRRVGSAKLGKGLPPARDLPPPPPPPPSSGSGGSL